MEMLPIELQTMICKKLDVKSLIAAASTCQSWRDMILGNRYIVGDKNMQLRIFNYPTQKTFLQKYGKSFQSLALKNNCVSRRVSNFLQNGQLVSLELDIDLNHNYVNPEFIKWLRKQDKLKKIVLKNNALNFVINEQLLSENLSFNLKEIVVQDGQVDPLTAVFIRQQSAEIEIFKFKEQTYYLSDEEINLLERALHGCHNLKHLYTSRFIGVNPQNIYVNLETIEIQHSEQRGNANIFDILKQTCPNLLWVCANN